jgi:hypothetical protein
MAETGRFRGRAYGTCVRVHAILGLHAPLGTQSIVITIYCVQSWKAFATCGLPWRTTTSLLMYCFCVSVSVAPRWPACRHSTSRVRMIMFVRFCFDNYKSGTMVAHLLLMEASWTKK